MLNGLDLFSGIGGIALALSDLVRPVAYCEIDIYCQGILLSRMRSGDIVRAPIWDDVRTLSKWSLPSIDIVYGGFPCQDVSITGAGAGLEGERSGLYFELIRLVGDIRPTFVRDGGYLPTPTARDYKSPGQGRQRRAKIENNRSIPLSLEFKHKFGLNLHPTFLEWMMGYDLKHTVLEPWAMQWYQSKLRKRSKN